MILNSFLILYGIVNFLCLRLSGQLSNPNIYYV